MYSLYELMQYYTKHKNIIDAHLKGESVEYYSGTDDNQVAGIGLTVFIVLLIIDIILWIWAIAITIIALKTLPEWAKVLAVLGLIPIIPFGPIVTLVVVYITKK